MNYIATIGLEVHVQLATKTKMFCSCRNEYGAEPNTHTCPVCLGLPGSLPVVNEQAVKMGLMAALALGCEVAPVSSFERKNYFYADIPKNYQITQYATPIGSRGVVEIESEGKPLRVGITRLHLEEDAGKLVHAEGEDFSLVDLNRAGVPLAEIVSEPDMWLPEQAHEYLTGLKRILRYIGASDCDMEKGQLRCDVNLSIRPEGSGPLGTRTEVKNLNSFRNVQRALAYEIERQTKVLNEGGIVVQETLLFDAMRGVTEVMRSKEEAMDYRYFPEPDLGPLKLRDGWMAEVQASLPELPAARKARLISRFELTEYAAGVLTAERPIADYFEACLQAGSDAKVVSNWIMGEVLREVNERKLEIKQLGVSPQNLVELIALVESGKVNPNTGKAVFVQMVDTGRSAAAIVDEKGLAQVNDEEAIEEAIQRAIVNNPKPVSDYLSGKKSAIGFLMGQVMRETKGKGNPKVVGPLLETAMKALQP